MRMGWWTTLALAAVLGAGCAPKEPPADTPSPGPATGGGTRVHVVDTGGGEPRRVRHEMHARVRLRVNCESICRNIARACRQSCRPQAWSPNMRSIRSACESDCRFNRFSCVHDCRGR